ncbi:MAG: type II secretion system F family protein [Acidimicrobiia bacterium]
MNAPVVVVAVLISARVVLGHERRRRVRRRLSSPQRRQFWLTYRFARSSRVDAAINKALPETLERVARSLRSGATMTAALAEAAASSPPVLTGDLAVVQRRIDDGAALTAALDDWAERRPLPAVKLAVAALGLARESGGSAARAVDAVASSLRERLAVEAEVKVYAAQAKLSALVIGAAPVAFAALTLSFDPYMRSVLATPAGIACIAAGCALDVVGAFWMTWLTRSSQWAA